MNEQQDAILNRIDEVIRGAIAGVETVKKYGGTLYTLKPTEKEGQFCGVFAYKDHVQLAFTNGTKLDDPAKLLSGTGKLRRHINFRMLADIDEAAISPLVKQAAAITIS